MQELCVTRFSERNNKTEFQPKSTVYRNNKGDFADLESILTGDMKMSTEKI